MNDDSGPNDDIPGDNINMPLQLLNLVIAPASCKIPRLLLCAQ